MGNSCQCSNWCKNPNNGIKVWVKQCKGHHYAQGFKYCAECEFGYKYHEEEPNIIFYKTNIKLRCFCCGHYLRHAPNIVSKSKIYRRKRKVMMEY